MGDKAIITEILEVTHLSDSYAEVLHQRNDDEFPRLRTAPEQAKRYQSIDEGEQRKEADDAGEIPREEKCRTVDEIIDQLGFGMFQIKLSLLTGIIWMADAMEMTLISFLGPALRCEWWLTSWQQALITTTVFCGMMLSSTMWGNISDAHGRKMALMSCTAILCFYAILSCFSPNFLWLLLLRAFVGFGIGGVPQSVTLYAEFLPSSQRARCVIFIEWLPESPRFLIAARQPTLALATLQKVAKENGRSLSVHKLPAPKTEVTNRGSFCNLFSRELRGTTVLLWIIWVSCAFCYYGLVLFTAELFQSGGIGETIPEVSCPLECKHLTTQDYTDIFWTTLSEFPGLIITAFLMEYFGRKMTMAIEFIVYTVGTLLLFICLDRTATTVIIFIARTFISGAFQAVFVYTPEVYPTISRSVGLGSCSAMSRIGALTTPFVAQVLAKAHVNLTIGVYALFGVIASAAVLLLPIETKGRAMTDVH